MARKRGHSGGARPGAGRRPGTGGTPGAGRPDGSIDVMPRERSTNGSSITTRKWAYAEKALRYADRMLEILYDIAVNGESETARVAAAGKILDRALGKAPQHVDVAAIKHTEIVYRSAAEIRQELLARGVPPVLLDYSPSSDQES
jgi:hypothetical protein